MLGTCVKARVVRPMGFTGDNGYSYPGNYGKICDTPQDEYAFILGVEHAVSYFSGKIVGLLRSKKRTEKRPHYWILAPKGEHVINLDIIEALDLENNFKDYELICYYEQSAGACAYYLFRGVPKYLLIKNRGSNNWGFPKGHLEKGETRADAARREVFEETGIRVKIHIGFEGVSRYIVHENCQKKVSIFVGAADTDRVTPQYTEIKEFAWLTYHDAMKALAFKNDRRILAKAQEYLYAKGILTLSKGDIITRKKRQMRREEFLKKKALEAEASEKAGRKIAAKGSTSDAENNTD